MIKRQISDMLVELSQAFPILVITGPRQSGKTTLVRSLFSDYDYVSMENPETRLQALSDPSEFLKRHPEKCIIDEVQHVAELMTSLSAVASKEKVNGLFILISSQNLLPGGEILKPLDKLAKMVNVMLPGQPELNHLKKYQEMEYETVILNGSFPAIYNHHFPPEVFYPSYIESFLRQDIRPIQNIRNLTLFLQFMKNCAGRAGQILDYSALARETGISVNSAKKWISILEAGFVVFLLQPYHNSFGKRLIKSPKLYFYDTGLLAYLLNIKGEDLLKQHPLKSFIFENYVILELLKYWYSKGLEANLFYWKDNRKNEIKCIVDGNPPNIIELREESTLKKDALKQVKLWNWLTGYDSSTCHVVYGGAQSFKFMTPIYSWKDLSKLCASLRLDR